jgi:hypothetical protein
LIQGKVEKARTCAEEALGSHISGRPMPSADDFEGRLRYVLRFYYDAFEVYDLVLYPIEYASPLGETNPVEIIRISPVDAKSLDGLPDATRELMGRRLHHFAGFLDKGWRRHDMVWGRLNAAECLIRALAPAADAPALIERAQEQILRDYAREVDGKAGADPLQWFAEQRPAETPSPPLTGSLKRGAPVVATILTDILNRRRGSASSAWNVLRGILPDKPGGPKALASLLFALSKLKPAIAAALVALPLLLLAGAVLIIVGHFWIGRAWTLVGVVLVSSAGVLLAVLLLVLALLVRMVRQAITKQVTGFLNPSK